MLKSLKIIATLLTIVPALVWAEGQFSITYGFENGNSLTGYHYGRQEYRHSLKSTLDKKMSGYSLLSEVSLFYSNLDRTHLQTIRVGFNDITLDQSLINISLGDNTSGLPYNSGMFYNRFRGGQADYKYRWASAGVFGGTPSDLYRRGTSLSSRNVFGSYLGIRPAGWLSEKFFIYNEASSLAEDTLSRRAVGFGQQLDITTSWGLEMMLSTAWKKRQEERGGATITRSAPSVSSNLTWAAEKYRVSGGMDFLGAHFRPMQDRNQYGPRLYAGWRPNKILGLNGRFANNNADGDTSYPMITNTWGGGSSLTLPNLPSLQMGYTSTDNKVYWGGLNARRYVSDNKFFELKQRANRFEMGLRFQTDHRTELLHQSMDASRHSWRLTPLYRAQLATFWLSGEFDRWSDTKQSSQGQFNRFRAGGDFGLWSGSRANLELGFDDRTESYYGRSGSFVASLKFKLNLTRNYHLDLSWWNDNVVNQDTGFFYLRDRSRLGLFITRKMDVSGKGLEGRIFMDANKNGIQESGEYGLPGIILNLSDGRRAITDRSGKYYFTNISQNQPSVKVDLATLSAEYNLIGSGEKHASLGGWSPAQVNFAVSALGGVKGRVFLDQNSNGIFDGDDQGISGVMLTMQPSNSAAVTNGGGMFRITNAPTGQQALIIDPNTIPPDFELKSEPSLQVSIKQGEVTNNLEFVLAKKVRPVKKVVFGGISTVKVSEASAMPASVSPKAAANKPVPGSSRVVTPRPGSVPAPAVSGPKLSPSEIDALYKEGSKLFSSGDYQGALKMWQKILSSEPGHASAKRNLERTRQKLEAQRKAKG
jgi:hypothetical protein